MRRLTAAYDALLWRERDAERARVDGYATQLASLEDKFAGARGPASRPLTVPAIFGRSYDENFISTYLAYALDPSRNGIGEAPLAQLLSLVGADLGDLSVRDVTVHREYQLRGGGRIDLLLEWKDAFVLGIENKILSVEGENQTAYYAEQVPLAIRGADYYFAYLTRTGEPAKSPQFHPVSYGQLLEALRQVHLSPATATRSRVLWEDLLEHLEVYIVMSDPTHFEFSERAKLYLEHRSMIEELVKAFNSDYGEAIAFIEQQLLANLDGGPWITDWRKGTSVWWKPVFKSHWQTQALFVHYEYWISVEDLVRGRLWFMAEAEGAQQARFLELFDRRYPGLRAQYAEKGMDYRPKGRKQAMAWKQYPISQDIEEVAQAFIDAFAEFRFLESEIDQVLAEMQES